MKRCTILLSFCFFLNFSCKKQDKEVIIDKKDPAVNSYVDYRIRKGEHYCDSNKLALVEYSELKFAAKFDSTAIYTTAAAYNQYDINKLYGFSDNNAAHQDYSARFGWRWSDHALRIFSYVYNSGVRLSKELATVQIGEENNYSIKVESGYYVFSVGSTTDTVGRASKGGKASGYKLYPYFGGDETAPHEIHIFIKDLPDK